METGPFRFDGTGRDSVLRRSTFGWEQFGNVLFGVFMRVCRRLNASSVCAWPVVRVCVCHCVCVVDQPIGTGFSLRSHGSDPLPRTVHDSARHLGAFLDAWTRRLFTEFADAQVHTQLGAHKSRNSQRHVRGIARAPPLNFRLFWQGRVLPVSTYRCTRRTFAPRIKMQEGTEIA